MTWFRGLEGVRAWLALAVLVEHVVGLTALPDHHPATRQLVHAGDSAVSVFIVISGFVITHMILERHEPYPLYLARRLLRLYPVYAVCLVLGLVSTLLLNRIMPLQPWGAAIPFTQAMARARASLAGNGLPLHLALHLSLLHGLVPDNLLFRAQLALLTPAWSLSLEWQFYLLAPLVVLALRRPDTTLLVTAIALGLYLLARKGVPGPYLMPSLLPGQRLAVRARHRDPADPARRAHAPEPAALVAAAARGSAAHPGSRPGLPRRLGRAGAVHDDAEPYRSAQPHRLPAAACRPRQPGRALGRPAFVTASTCCIFPILQLLLCAAGAWHLGYWMTVATLAIAGLPLTLLGADPAAPPCRAAWHHARPYARSALAPGDTRPGIDPADTRIPTQSGDLIYTGRRAGAGRTVRAADPRVRPAACWTLSPSFEANGIARKN